MILVNETYKHLKHESSTICFENKMLACYFGGVLWGNVFNCELDSQNYMLLVLHSTVNIILECLLLMVPKNKFAGDLPLIKYKSDINVSLLKIWAKYFTVRRTPEDNLLPMFVGSINHFLNNIIEISQIGTSQLQLTT